MSDEKLSQAEIDFIFATINSAPDDVKEIDAKDIELHYNQHKKLYRQLASAQKRYEFAMECGASYSEIQELRRDLHYYAFRNWLMHKWMDKEQYYALMRKEMKKRGMR